MPPPRSAWSSSADSSGHAAVSVATGVGAATGVLAAGVVGVTPGDETVAEGFPAEGVIPEQPAADAITVITEKVRRIRCTAKNPRRAICRDRVRGQTGA